MNKRRPPKLQASVKSCNCVIRSLLLGCELSRTTSMTSSVSLLLVENALRRETKLLCSCKKTKTSLLFNPKLLGLLIFQEPQNKVLEKITASFTFADAMALKLEDLRMALTMAMLRVRMAK